MIEIHYVAAFWWLLICKHQQLQWKYFIALQPRCTCPVGIILFKSQTVRQTYQQPNITGVFFSLQNAVGIFQIHEHSTSLYIWLWIFNICESSTARYVLIHSFQGELAITVKKPKSHLKAPMLMRRSWSIVTNISLQILILYESNKSIQHSPYKFNFLMLHAVYMVQIANNGWRICR